MNWQPTEITLGILKVNQTTEVKFLYTGDTPELIKQERIRVSCGCSIPMWNSQTKELTIIYTPNPIPQHIKMQGKSSYESTKHAIVDFGTWSDKLIFTATIIK